MQRSYYMTEELRSLNTCLICGTSQNKINLLFKVNQYNFYQCRGCKFVFLDAKNIKIEEKMALNEEKYGNPRQGKRPRALVREDRLALRQICQFVSSGNLLEVGCGDGGLLVESQLSGWNVWGIELSSGAAKLAVDALGGKKIHCGTIMDCSFKAEFFDVVIMKSLIEHVLIPQSEIQKAHRLLKPNGLLYILTPNIESLDAKLYKRHWFALAPGDHLCFFSPNTLKRLLQNNGFETIWLITSVSYEDIVWGLLFAAKSLFSEIRKLLRKNEVLAPGSMETLHGVSERKLTPGLLKDKKRILRMLYEGSRYASLPLFLLYSALIAKTSYGACIRGIFQKKLPTKSREESTAAIVRTSSF